jgi:hypothetical protein
LDGNASGNVSDDCDGADEDEMDSDPRAQRVSVNLRCRVSGNGHSLCPIFRVSCSYPVYDRPSVSGQCGSSSTKEHNGPGKSTRPESPLFDLLENASVAGEPEVMTPTGQTGPEGWCRLLSCARFRSQPYLKRSRSTGKPLRKATLMYGPPDIVLGRRALTEPHSAANRDQGPN